jgi:ribonuclease P protein component
VTSSTSTGVGVTPPAETFGKEDRLLVRRDFLRVQHGGRKVSSPHLVALFSPGRTPRRRIGLVVSTKVGNAVERNRVKRWLREVFRKERQRLPERLDLVVIARSGSPDLSLAKIRSELLDIMRRQGDRGTSGKPREPRT